MGLRARAATKRSATAEDGDMALALALQQSEIRSAEMQAQSAAQPLSVQSLPAPSLTCGGSGNFQARPNSVQHSPPPSFTCGGSGDFQSTTSQLWHSAVATPPTPTATEPAFWVDEDKHLERTFSRKLSNVKYSKHLPRVNSQPPTPEDSSTARARLLSRLDMYGLCEVSVSGDGNCQFRAVADQLYRSPDEHGYVRAAVVAQLQQYPTLYCEYIPEDYQQYCYKMHQFGTWGDHVTLQAVADAFGVRIVVMTSYRDSCVIEIQPQSHMQSQRILHLSFWAEVHYNSVYPLGEAPQPYVYKPDSKVLGSKKIGRMLSAFS